MALHQVTAPKNRSPKGLTVSQRRKRHHLYTSFSILLLSILLKITTSRQVLRGASCPEGTDDAGDGVCRSVDVSEDDRWNSSDAGGGDGVASVVTGVDLRSDGGDDGDGEDCVDGHAQCDFWAGLDECAKNPGYMLNVCKKSCNVCKGKRNEVQDRNSIQSERDSMTPDAETVQKLELEAMSRASQRATNKDDDDATPENHYGTKQNCRNPKCLAAIKTMNEYMTSPTLLNDPLFDKVKHECQNRHVDCAKWVSIGECDANPGYMKIHCAPLCGTCLELSFEHRCPDNPDAKQALGPGDLNRMFDRIVDGDDRDVWNATVHSRPSHPRGYVPAVPGGQEVETKLGTRIDGVDYILGPWVITIDNFVSEPECDRLIELGSTEGYQRSTDVGGQNFDGTTKAVQSSSRTSNNAWCKGECLTDEKTQLVLKNIERLTGIPDEHSEHLQLLRYEQGQFYKSHHDYILIDRDRPCGCRVLTAYLYLNDVEAGGGTKFNLLNITVMPKKGRLLLWPSVRDEDPNSKDHRTTHEALPVEKGEKFGANGWIHMRDFKTPHRNGCT